MWMSSLLKLLVASALFVAPSAEEQSATQAERPIVVRNEYWAKEGLVDEVYRHRLHASDVRAELGLYRGRVLRRVGDSEHQPDVVWECEYPSLVARETDLRALGESGRFEPVMEKMGTLIKKFDRSVWRVSEAAGEPR